MFNLIRLGSTKNNVRPKEWIDAMNIAAEKNKEIINNKAKSKLKSKSRDESEITISPPDISTLRPTISYNNAILEDTSILPLSELSKQLINHATYQKATILLKVRMTQLKYSLSVKIKFIFYFLDLVDPNRHEIWIRLC